MIGTASRPSGALLGQGIKKTNCAIFDRDEALLAVKPALPMSPSLNTSTISGTTACS
jgi:hypothetical protein